MVDAPRSTTPSNMPAHIFASSALDGTSHPHAPAELARYELPQNRGKQQNRPPPSNSSCLGTRVCRTDDDTSLPLRGLSPQLGVTSKGPVRELRKRFFRRRGGGKKKARARFSRVASLSYSARGSCRSSTKRSGPKLTQRWLPTYSHPAGRRSRHPLPLQLPPHCPLDKPYTRLISWPVFHHLLHKPGPREDRTQTTTGTVYHPFRF